MLSINISIFIPRDFSFTFKMDYTTSGWLYKLSSANKFRSSKWQLRYFVLLDTELRYYKNEYSIDASNTINLRNVSSVEKTSHPKHNYCFNLKMTENYKEKNSKCQKTWTMECNSEHELDIWLAAINLRLSNFNDLLKQSFNSILQSPKSTKNLISRRRGIVLASLETESLPVLDDDIHSCSSKESILSSLLEEQKTVPSKISSQGFCIFSINKYSSDSLS